MKKFKNSTIKVAVRANEISSVELSTAPVKFAMDMHNAIPIIALVVGDSKTTMAVSPSQCALFHDSEIKELLAGDIGKPLKMSIEFIDNASGESFLTREIYLSFPCSSAFFFAMYDYYHTLIDDGPIPTNLKPCYFEVKDLEAYMTSCVAFCECRNDDLEEYPSGMLNPYFFDSSFFAA